MSTWRHRRHRSNRGPRIVVTSVQGRDVFEPDVAARLDAVADVTYVACAEPLSAGRARSAFADADIVAVTPKVTPVWDDALLASLPRLRAIALHATGYDMLDADLLARHGVALSILPSYSTASVAEHAIGLVLSLTRRVHLANDRSRGLVPATTSLRGVELEGRTLGVVGTGRIGSRVALVGAALGMRVVSFDRDPERVGPGAVGSLDTLLATSDVVVLTCSADHGAPPIIGAPQLARLAPGSFLVNASRASLVDSAALVEAVRSRHLRGYAVDDAVFVGPEVADLLVEGRILQTGHCAWWSDEALRRGASQWAGVLLALATAAPTPLVVEGTRLAPLSRTA